MLAVLKAGGGLSADRPGLPGRPDRLHARGRPAARASVAATAGRDCAEPDGAAAGCPDAADRPRAVRPGQPAYVIYTSGSTGARRAWSSRTARWRNCVATPGRAVRRSAPAAGCCSSRRPSFDVVALELCLPLLSGGRLVVAPHGRRRDPGASPSCCARRHGSPSSTATPRLLAAHGAAGRTPPGAAGPVVGGEALPGRLAGAGAAGPPACSTPTARPRRRSCVDHRAACAAAHRPCRSARRSRTPGCTCSDAGLRPVPPGVRGRAVPRRRRAGPRLPRPARADAERFVADPFGRPAAGCTAPATWCAGRRTAQLEFLGRADDQVKIRGFRIELGEIEARAGRAPRRSAQAVVVVRDEPAGERSAGRLRGPRADARTPWPRCSPSCAPTCARRLPDYMVPAAVVLLAALPLTAERKGRPPGAARPRLRPAVGRTAAPRTAARRTCCALFAEVLGLEPRSASTTTSSTSAETASVPSRSSCAPGRSATRSAPARSSSTARWPGSRNWSRTQRGARHPGRAARRRRRLGPAAADAGTTSSPWAAASAASPWPSCCACPGGIDRAELLATVQAVLDRHDVLRSRLDRPAPGLQIAAPGAVDARRTAAGGRRRPSSDVQTELDAAAGRLDPDARCHGAVRLVRPPTRTRAGC